MLRLAVSVARLLMTWSLLAAIALPGEESRDVTFSTPYEVGKPTTANFYYNGRAIGVGREGFAEIVARIDKLPPGTSVVWGPEYGRCHSCSGMEPNCVPKFLYPDLWQKLEASVKGRRLLLSSTYPGPNGKVSFDYSIPGTMPAPGSEDDPTAKQRFDATLSWQVSEMRIADKARSGQPPASGIVAGRFLSEGKTLEGYDIEQFFGRLAEGSRVRISVSWSGEGGLPKDADRLSSLARQIRAAWPEGVNEELTRGRLTAVVTAPAPLAAALQAEERLERKQQRLNIEWRNFHGPNTPPEDVLYLLNGQFIGRGDQAFQRLLGELEKLPERAEVTIPQYELRGRWARESFSDEELRAKNAELRGVVPFSARRAEFDAVIAKRNLIVQYNSQLPGLGSDTVIDWESSDQHGNSFVSFGRIVRYDGKPSKAAATLGWVDYEPTRSNTRQPESRAVYTLNDVRMGKGVEGFAEAMERIGKLPEGSIVNVRVCLRTKGPFVCPIVYDGHRHFERTGFEPYIGMFPWLVDVAKKGKLEIQWIPDEQKSCLDCEREIR
jgi:hypothetical protein